MPNLADNLQTLVKDNVFQQSKIDEEHFLLSDMNWKVLQNKQILNLGGLW